MAEAGEPFELNRKWWDERVAGHVASEFYDVERFRQGGSTLRPFELEEVGDVTGLRLAHLQCHFGLDSMSWARHGASVRGLDFSGPAVEAANGLARELEIDADFVEADVYEAVEALGGERFDIVYTGFGALEWLPDLQRWAGVVAELLKPGGFLYLSEFHPITWIFGEGSLKITDNYFNNPAGEQLGGEDDQGSYANEGVATTNNTTINWQYTMADVITAALGAGLRLETLSEHDYTLTQLFPHLIEDREQLEAGSVFKQPEGGPRLPLMFSLRARA